MLVSSKFTSLAMLGMLLTSARASDAQAWSSPSKSWEFRLTSGELVATGDQRDFLKDAKLNAAQVAWAVRPSIAVIGTFGWARSRDLNAIDTPKLDVFTSDVGIEVRPVRWFTGRSVTLSPFAGVGGGARSYNYRSLNEDARHNLAGYGTIGADVGIGRVGILLEARNYVSGFKPLAGTGRSETRNDVVITAAFSLKKKR
jgi:hypothetical protein